MVKVSVLLSSYNHAEYLKMSIDSILNQTFTDFELIIIDDCSQDDSWNIIKSYKDKRIRKVRNKKNQGYILTRQLVETFKGKYFAVAHCDDYWESTKLEKQVRYLEEHVDVAACFSYVKLINEEGEEIDSKQYTDFNLENRSRLEWLNYFFYHGNCLCHPSILIRKEVQLNLNLFTYGLRSLPDFYRWVKLCLFHEIYIYPEKLTCFRIRKNALNTSGYNYHNLVRCSLEELKILDLYLSLGKEDFLQVFPQASCYVVHDFIDVRYAFARICIDEIKRKSYVLYGLNVIYELLQDETSRLGLEKKYHYGNKEFMMETGNADVFQVINSTMIQHSTLFFDVGNDYNESDSLRMECLVRQDNGFEIMFCCEDKKVKGIRFDPDENCYKYFYDVRIFVNNEEVTYSTNCSFLENGKYYFYHTDPSFFIPFEGILENFYIVGKVGRLDNEDIIQYLVSDRVDKILQKNQFSNKVKDFFKKFFHR